MGFIVVVLDHWKFCYVADPGSSCHAQTSTRLLLRSDNIYIRARPCAPDAASGVQGQTHDLSRHRSNRKLQKKKQFWL